MVVRPTHSPSDQPLNLRPQGPLKMPQLHEEPQRRGCWECGSKTHRRKHCPFRNCPNQQCTYCQSCSHQSPQCLFKRLNMTPPPTRTVGEALAHKENIPTWCSKCLRNNPGHEGVDCPTRELCRNCGRCGNLYFLQMHNCSEPSEQHMYGQDNEVVDPELYRNGES